MVKGQSCFQAMSFSIEDRSSPNRIEVSPIKRMPFRIKGSHASNDRENSTAIKPINSAANAPRHAKTNSSSSSHSCQEDPLFNSKSKSPTPGFLRFSPPKGPRILDNISKSPSPLCASASPPRGPRIPVGTPIGPKAWPPRSIDYSPSRSLRKLLTSAKPATDPAKPFPNTANEVVEFRLSQTASLRDSTKRHDESVDRKHKDYHPADSLLSLLNAPEFKSTTSSARKRKAINEGRLSPRVSPSRERKHRLRRGDEEVFNKVYIKPERLYNDHYSPHPSREASPDRKKRRRSGAQQRNEKRERDSKERLKRKEREERRDLKTVPIMKVREIESKSHSPTLHGRHIDSQAQPKLTVLLAPIAVIPRSLSSGTRPKEVCYNCGRQGHWFMDCVTSCGRCGGDGHRTIDCPILYQKTD